MAVLQLSIPGPSGSASALAPATATTPATAAAVNGPVADTITPTPSRESPVRSIGGNSINFSTTPVTSNLAPGAFFNARNAAAAAIASSNVRGGLPLYGGNVADGSYQTTSNSMMVHQQQQRPASFLPVQSMNGGNVTLAGIASQQVNNAVLGNISNNPPWISRAASPGIQGAVHQGRITSTSQSANFLGNVTVGGTLANPLGTVTVGGPTAIGNNNMGTGYGSRNRLLAVNSAQLPANALGTVTIGGGGSMAMPNATYEHNLGAFGSRARLANNTLQPTANNHMLGPVTVSGGAGRPGLTTDGGGGSSFANRSSRLVAGGGAGAMTRPPLLPVGSTSSLLARREMGPPTKEQNFMQHLGSNSMRGLPSTPGGNKMGINGSVMAGVPNQTTMVDYEDYKHGTDGEFGGTDSPTLIPEVALTTGLVTLSIHEALTFDGTELALHPDVFSKGSKNVNGKGKVDGKKDDATKTSMSYSLQPGDLVEIRVWSPRPGMAAEAAALSQDSTKRGSVAKSNSKATRPSTLHSRNTSLATVSSSISNTSMLTTTPRTTLSVPKVVGGDNLLSTPSLGGSPSSASASEAGGRLFGENLLEMATPKDQQETSAAMGSNISSVFSGASNLFRKISAATPIDSGAPPPPPMPPGGTGEENVTASMISHSRDSSSTTAGGATNMHSRDSSLLTTSTSWMNALHSSRSLDQETTPQISPSTTAAMEPVAEGQPQPHPLLTTTNLSQLPELTQVLPMRRDGSSLMAISSTASTASSGPTAQQQPPHPFALGSGTSTPSTSRPSSPKNQQQNNTPTTTPPTTSLPRLSIASHSKNPSASSVSSQRPPPAAAVHTRDSSKEVSITSSPARQTAGSLVDFSLNSVEDKIALPSVPDITSNTADSTTINDQRQRASTADTAPAVSSSQVDPIPASSSHHTRNNSIALTGALSSASNGHNLVPPMHNNRRYRGTASESLLTGSSSQRGATSTSNNGDDANTATDINDILYQTHLVRVSFVMPISEGSLTSIKSGARTQVSLLRQVADLYAITAYDTVTVTQITRSRAPFVRRAVSADFLTISFKDQFVSRGDMYNFQKSFVNSWVYEGKRLSFNGIRTNTKVIRHGDHVIRSGLISEDTKLTFRSRSARIIWLVQMSSEMWDFASPYEAAGNQKSQGESSCKIYFDKFVDFVRRLFHKWKKLQLTHNLTVVFFSRTYIRHHDGEHKEEKTSSSAIRDRSASAVHVDSDGRMFEDHYKIVIENETNADYDSLIHRMKQEFIRYPKLVRWDLTTGNERTPSTASQGNVLEAINITLNLLHLHYIDRDLHRTGNSVVIITAGNGVFEIEKNLAGITKQRMMDNGIGSDMLSLGLPPLHVAPFFLFKEKGTSKSAEEIQGFDDWKTYFEVPHWMNLSFVDYDYEEETMLYKEHLNDDDTFADAALRENETISQTWNASNGFMKRGSPDSFVAPEIQPTVSANLSRQRYKHLISDRGFEDILQACRPRSRGEYGSGLPTSLTILLKRTKGSVSDRHLRKASLDRVSSTRTQHGRSLGDVGCLTPQRAANVSRRYLEWGAVNFDDFAHKRLNSSQQTLNGSFSESQSSPSSSFTSRGSFKFPSQLFGVSHLQSTISLEGGGQSLSSGGGDTHFSMLKKRISDGSMTIDNEETHKEAPEILSLEKGHTTLSAIQILMTDHDNNTFSRTPKTHRANNSIISQNHIEDTLKNSINEPFCPGSPMHEGRGILRTQSAMLPAGGIEAALVQYDGTRQRKEDTVPRGTVAVEVSDEAAGRSALAVSPLSIGMPYSLDRRNEGLRPSVMRLVAPDAIPLASRLGSAADGFLPSEFQRKNSFFLNHNKAHNQNTKEVRRGDRHHQRGKSIENGRKQNSHQLNTEVGDAGDPRPNAKAVSPQRGKNKKHHSRKHHHHQSYRQRRKHWVLNPFRQEDEDEVLARWNHNRRRWSHVFPLGEDEFKRHAGPNWRSLCQPAILPMTIDFHPSPQDLEDQKKFSVKQYSVTLPPMDETYYKSHAELLDDLLIQRMRQDFQIVPRNIIQQNPRRDVADNQLEATLSMGHKIQRLSYNTSTDSVDVIQYYAKFAEDETPQTYRYHLWSALRQDYVSVFQTFTKYTLPYKWNELDMLISGDTVTTIQEGMRYPRISFVIIPDPIVDSHGEKQYLDKFQRLVEYFSKLTPKGDSKNVSIEIHTSNDSAPQASAIDKRFVVDLRKKRDDKYEWMELVHDSNCDTRRTFRMTLQWLVAVASKIDQQAQLLHRRCSQYGLKLVSVPHFSCLRSCFMNPFAVPIKKEIRNKTCVDTIENALTNEFNFVYDGSHMSDPNEIDSLDGFDFVVNKWSMKKRKKFVPARQYLHRNGVLFTRILRDTRGRAILIIYLNQRHIAGDEQLLNCARTVFNALEKYIAKVCKESGCDSQ